MGLRDVLRKREQASAASGGPAPGAVPEFTFLRTDTHTTEVLRDHSVPNYTQTHLSPVQDNKSRHSLDVFRSSRSRSASTSSRASEGGKKEHRRSMFHRREPTSEYVPADLPQISGGAGGLGGAEEDWERRGIILATSRPASPGADPARGGRPAGGLTNKEIDADIQRAIKAHEDGDLVASTRLFGQLADPNGANNPLSQVLYGLALRHGWGCEPDADAAVHYLSKAASNSAAVEQMALQAGLKKGGAAKGELVLAIFELANCFRHGWGIAVDPVAAKQYYETAANLGDTDAMNEVAWCYNEGFGCKKDRYAAARYYRLAEKNGNKIIGNSWIWKEKYGPPEEPVVSKK
ncbi:uncharacterized protein DNG_00587 [Cephalotrichum gorgonifer]|uniref:Uncharacterized protein n=1 Tax=Cephalotrichum gorgonifer TaxID=2041049 RepID=A0AAE8MR97_9PEZI|nr:uncharacterized protein DNG_00587 [Cephalotrichum gorgonifer]